jgi:hypothetical protein
MSKHQTRALAHSTPRSPKHSSPEQVEAAFVDEDVADEDVVFAAGDVIELEDAFTAVVPVADDDDEVADGDTTVSRVVGTGDGDAMDVVLASVVVEVVLLDAAVMEAVDIPIVSVLDVKLGAAEGAVELVAVDKLI